MTTYSTYLEEEGDVCLDDAEHRQHEGTRLVETWEHGTWNNNREARNN
jgi:hypothetical protein